MKEGLVLVLLACAVASSFGQGTVTVCQNTYEMLSCSAAETVTIISATYGRAAGGKCSSAGASNTMCSEDVADRLQKVCTGMSTCGAFDTSMPGYLFTGLCPLNPQAYLEVEYTCTHRPVAVIACGGESTSIDCSDLDINIVTAVWGRTVLNDCTGELEATDLGDCELDVMSYMSALCDDMTSCTFTPRNKIFGGNAKRPCKKEKYLNLTYTCEG